MTTEEIVKLAGIKLPDIDYNQYDYSPVGEVVTGLTRGQVWSDGAWRYMLNIKDDGVSHLIRFQKPKRFRAAPGKRYFYANSLGECTPSDYVSHCDVLRHGNGNYWRDAAQCKAYILECEKVAEKLHKEFGE